MLVSGEGRIKSLFSIYGGGVVVVLDNGKFLDIKLWVKLIFYCLLFFIDNCFLFDNSVLFNDEEMWFLGIKIYGLIIYWSMNVRCVVFM